ncbi:MAG TPA: LytTR family DNA-binding domain-containing protein [Chitinophaga sp.]
MILTFLQQPYPVASMRSRIFTPILFGVFICLFLLVFQPFGLSELPFGQLAWGVAGYGLVTALVIFLEMWTGPLLFPAFFAETNWTVGRHIFIILADVFFIGLGNLLFTAWYLNTSLSFYAIAWFQVITVAVGVLPVAMYVMYSQIALQKKYAAEASMIDAHVQERKQHEAEKIEGLIIIGAENAEEGLQLAPSQLLFIAAADNYIKVHHLEQGRVKQTLLRSTLKKAAAGLADHPQFFRCHRTFLVNLDHVNSINGNAQGYKLQLAHTEEWLPVSRSLHDEIRQKL